MFRRTITVLAILALALAAAASAAKQQQEYHVAVVSASAGTASFTVTRSVADNSPVAWLQTDCEGAIPTSSTVSWDSDSSLTGTAINPASGWCRSWVTVKPWQGRPSPHITNVVEFYA